MKHNMTDEQIDKFAEFTGIMCVLIFKTIFWGGMGFIVFHFVVKFW